MVTQQICLPNWACHWKQKIVNLMIFFTSGAVSCHYHNLRYHQWWQSCQINELLFSVWWCIISPWKTYCMSNAKPLPNPWWLDCQLDAMEKNFSEIWIKMQNINIWSFLPGVIEFRFTLFAQWLHATFNIIDPDQLMNNTNWCDIYWSGNHTITIDYTNVCSS